jgi:CRISPR type III-A/MTUBE-associated protein Csm6
MGCVLFSAIGATDPIRDGFDGPMLHIVRHFTPEKVYLYFTSEMAKREQMYEDNCCVKAVKLLLPECEVIPIYTDIEDPSDFDAFYSDFNGIITRIRNENADAEILLNVSSATPQIITANCLEVVTHNVLLTPVQVKTHARKANMNRKHFNPAKDDLEYEMGELLENLEEAEKRIHIPNLNGVKKSMLKKQIKALTESYEYKGAYQLIKEKEKTRLFTERLRLLLLHAYRRSLPDEKGARDAATGLDMYADLYPVQNNAAMKVCEYYLAARLRRSRGELTDFVLRIAALTECLLRTEVDKSLPKGLKSIARKDGNKGWKLNKKIFEQNEPAYSKDLDKEYAGGYLDVAIGLDVLGKLSEILKITGYERLLKSKGGRNTSAHDLNSISEQDLLDCGASSIELQSDLEEAIKRLYGNHVKPSVFNVYERINEMIDEELDKAYG